MKNYEMCISHCKKPIRYILQTVLTYQHVNTATTLESDIDRCNKFDGNLLCSSVNIQEKIWKPLSCIFYVRSIPGAVPTDKCLNNLDIDEIQ